MTPSRSHRFTSMVYLVVFGFIPPRASRAIIPQTRFRSRNSSLGALGRVSTPFHRACSRCLFTVHVHGACSHCGFAMNLRVVLRIHVGGPSAGGFLLRCNDTVHVAGVFIRTTVFWIPTAVLNFATLALPRERELPPGRFRVEEWEFSSRRRKEV